MLSSGANVIIRSKCYHLVLSCDIIPDENTLLFDFPKNFTHSLCMKKSGKIASHMLNKQRYSFLPTMLPRQSKYRWELSRYSKWEPIITVFSIIGDQRKCIDLCRGWCALYNTVVSVKYITCQNCDAAWHWCFVWKQLHIACRFW
jgi:hypothetical protein